MSPSIGSSGVQLIQSSDALLERSAETVRRASAAPPEDGAPDPSANLPGAMLDVIGARFESRLGAALIRADDEAKRSVLDIFA